MCGGSDFIIVEQHPPLLSLHVSHVMSTVHRLAQVDYHCLQLVVHMRWVLVIMCLLGFLSCRKKVQEGGHVAIVAA